VPVQVSEHQKKHIVRHSYWSVLQNSGSKYAAPKDILKINHRCRSCVKLGGQSHQTGN